MEMFFQLLVNGIAFGSIYAMVAVGLTIVFGILEVVNFAQGEFYMLAAYVTFLVYLTQLPYPLAIAIAVATMIVIGLIVERFAIRPLIGRAWQLPILSTLGISIIMQNGAIVLWTPNPRTIIIDTANLNIHIFGVVIVFQKLMIIFFALALFIGLHYFIQRTKTGKAMRAVSQNKEACRIIGIDVPRISSITFALGAGLSGFGGALVAPVMAIHPVMGILLVLKCFAAVIMGGFGNIKGTICSAFILAIVESFAVAYVSLQYKDVFAFLVMIIILLFRPAGIFGKKVGI
ncbi:MAG: branched-chain amino acid ABC transporter permease [Deltaproteobacteria bacterium]|nr:branched-chain amino acid ABC transporter permease [Deltaproteobacteria bacterium]